MKGLARLLCRSRPFLQGGGRRGVSGVSVHALSAGGSIGEGENGQSSSDSSVSKLGKLLINAALLESSLY